MGSQVVEEDALSHASLDGDCVIVLMDLDGKVRRHLDSVNGILHPTGKQQRQLLGPYSISLSGMARACW